MPHDAALRHDDGPRREQEPCLELSSRRGDLVTSSAVTVTVQIAHLPTLF
jgi:hypothetical protein